MADESVEQRRAARRSSHSGSGSLIPRAPPLGQQCLTWSRVVTPSDAILPPPRSGAASVVVKGKLYVFGGYGGGTGRLDDFWSYHFESGVWEEVQVLSQEKPGCRENNGVVISDSSRSIYLFGGYNGKQMYLRCKGLSFILMRSPRA
jgi:Kelch motif